MFARCLRSRDVFCNIKSMKNSSKDRSANVGIHETAEVPPRFGSPSPPPTMVASDDYGSAVDQEDKRSCSKRKKRKKEERLKKKEDRTSCLSRETGEFDLPLEVSEKELIDLLSIHRKEEGKQLEHRKHLLGLSAELLAKEERLMAQLAELRTERRTCNTSLGEVLNTIDTCRFRIESNEAQLAAVRDKKSQEEARRARAFGKELKKQRLDAVKNLDRERDKNMCQICMSCSRDAMVLPCMHFLYCSDCLQKHQMSRNDCPTCRGPITALLLCKLISD